MPTSRRGSIVTLACNDLNDYFIACSTVSAAKGGLSPCRDCGFGVVAKMHSRWIQLNVAHLFNICDMHGVAGTARINLKLYLAS